MKKQPLFSCSPLWSPPVPFLPSACAHQLLQGCGPQVSTVPLARQTCPDSAAHCVPLISMSAPGFLSFEEFLAMCPQLEGLSKCGRQRQHDICFPWAKCSAQNWGSPVQRGVWPGSRGASRSIFCSPPIAWSCSTSAPLQDKSEG